MSSKETMARKRFVGEEDSDWITFQDEFQDQLTMLQDKLAPDDYYREYEFYQRGAPFPFCEEAFNKLLHEQRFGIITKMLYAYADTQSQYFKPVKDWVLLHAEQGHVPLLCFAARIHLKMQPVNMKQGFTCAVKALMRAAQDISVNLSARHHIYDYLRHRFYVPDIGYVQSALALAIGGPYLKKSESDTWPSFKEIFGEVSAWLKSLPINQDSCDDADFIFSTWCDATEWSTVKQKVSFSDVRAAASVAEIGKKKAINDRRKISLELLLNGTLKSLDDWRSFFSKTIHQLLVPSVE